MTISTRTLHYDASVSLYEILCKKKSENLQKRKAAPFWVVCTSLLYLFAACEILCKNCENLQKTKSDASADDRV
jgi:hypothetical protein